MKVFWICLCLIHFAACFTLASETSRTNLLFVLTEDQGAHAGHLGTPGIKTPAIDSLASSGVVFPHAFVAYPVCSASKASIYTGLHNHTNGILNNTLNHHRHPDKVTTAEKKHPLYQKNRIHTGPTLTATIRPSACNPTKYGFHRTCRTRPSFARTGPNTPPRIPLTPTSSNASSPHCWTGEKKPRFIHA